MAEGWRRDGGETMGRRSVDGDSRAVKGWGRDSAKTAMTRYMDVGGTAEGRQRVDVLF